MIMAAGLGTRLRPLTGRIPKPMVPVAGTPVMAHVVALARRHGLTELCANLHYLPDTITGHFGDGAAHGVSMTWNFEPDLLGTAGGVREMAAFLSAGGGPFVVLSADAMTDIDLGALVAAHRAAKNVATVGLTRVDDPTHYGVAVLDDEGQITGFQEKPAAGTERSNLANCGIYVFEPSIFERIDGGVQDWAHDVFPRLLAQGARFGGATAAGYWNDVGSLGEYLASNADVLTGAVHVDGLGTDRGDALWIGDGAHVEPSAALSGPIALGAGCRIQADAVLIGPVTVGAGAVVGARAALRETVVWPGYAVPPDTVAVGGVLGDASALARRYTGDRPSPPRT